VRALQQQGRPVHLPLDTRKKRRRQPKSHPSARRLMQKAKRRGGARGVILSELVLTPRAGRDEGVHKEKDHVTFDIQVTGRNNIDQTSSIILACFLDCCCSIAVAN
jgi:hypothetical protein